MIDNTIVVKDRTADKLLDLLECVENLHGYFSVHDRFTIERRFLEFWIDDIFKLWESLEESYDDETDRNDILYLLNQSRQ